MAGLLDKRLIFVTGKGGTGKSTVSIALGMAAARQGKRTIVAEVSRQERVAHAFHHDAAGFTETEIAPNLFTLSIDSSEALKEYFHIQIRVKPVADLLSSSRVIGYFAAATPGMAELMSIGKVWELAQFERRKRDSQPYDLVIVDAPATGHGLAMLLAPRTFAEIARVGPVAQQGRTIHRTISDADFTAVIAVAIPEEMAVNETFSLDASLRTELGRPLDLVVMNGLHPDRFSEEEAERLRAAIDDGPGPDERAALQAAMSAHVRARAQTRELARLDERIEPQPARLPFVFTPELDEEQLELLSRDLEAAL